PDMGIGPQLLASLAALSSLLVPQGVSRSALEQVTTAREEPRAEPGGPGYRVVDSRELREELSHLLKSPLGPRSTHEVAITTVGRGRVEALEEQQIATETKTVTESATRTLYRNVTITSYYKSEPGVSASRQKTVVNTVYAYKDKPRCVIRKRGGYNGTKQ